jgi:hypothetical protein
MRKLTMLCIAFICALLIIAGFGQANAQKVLVNIWDGTEWTKISKLYDAGKVPNAGSIGPLFRLTCITECFPSCGCDGCCMRTLTKPQHATMLTGVWADEHGVFTNRCYQLIPENLTVYERIESKDHSIKTAHISSKPKNFGKPTFGNIIENVDYFVAKDISPKAAADRAMRLIHAWRSKDFLIVCHFKKPDSTGHAHGVDSKEYRKAILNCDSQLGRILDVLAHDDILDETKIYVLSDHGFGAPRPNKHGDSPNTFIITNDEEMRDIYMDQVAGFLLTNFGIEF